MKGKAPRKQSLHEKITHSPQIGSFSAQTCCNSYMSYGDNIVYIFFEVIPYEKYIKSSGSICLMGKTAASVLLKLFIEVYSKMSYIWSLYKTLL